MAWVKCTYNPYIGDWQPPLDVAPHIVCAAIWYEGTPYVVCGPRHFDTTMRAMVNILEGGKLVDKDHVLFQGFVDQWGRFYDRKSAAKLVVQTGQIPAFLIKRSGLEDHLFSEALY